MVKIHGRLVKLNEENKFQEKMNSYSFLENINFKNKKVLEIGSGWGALSTKIALSGAKKVFGIDINKELIDFSNNVISKKYPYLSKNLRFVCCKIKDLKEYNFDYIVSENTFEHIYNLDKFLDQAKKRLKINGKLYSIFAPLYYSPFGDHRRFYRAMERYNNIKIPQIVFPWMHLIIPDKILNKIVEYFYRLKNNREIKFNVHEGINKLKLYQYKSIFHNSGFYVKSFKTNHSYFEYQIKNRMKNLRLAKILIKIFRIMQNIAFLKEYFTVSIMVKLIKK